MILRWYSEEKWISSTRLASRYVGASTVPTGTTGILIQKITKNNNTMDRRRKARNKTRTVVVFQRY